MTSVQLQMSFTYFSLFSNTWNTIGARNFSSDEKRRRTTEVDGVSCKIILSYIYEFEGFFKISRHSEINRAPKGERSMKRSTRRSINPEQSERDTDRHKWKYSRDTSPRTFRPGGSSEPRRNPLFRFREACRYTHAHTRFMVEPPTIIHRPNGASGN